MIFLTAPENVSFCLISQDHVGNLPTGIPIIAVTTYRHCLATYEDCQPCMNKHDMQCGSIMASIKSYMHTNHSQILRDYPDLLL